MVREFQILDVQVGSGKPVFGSNYYVTAYEPGATVSIGSSGGTLDVDAGHGFEANDKGMVGTDPSRYFQVASKTSTQLTLANGQTLFVAAGETLVNLGADTGVTAPNYDGSGAAIYTDMDYGNLAVNSTVMANDVGKGLYYHKGIAIWELVRTSELVPFEIHQDVTVSSSGEDQVAYEIRYAWLFATSGSGTEADKFSLAGSNPVQAAIDDLPDTGGIVELGPFHYDIGSADPAITIPILTSSTDVRAYVLRGAGRDLTFLHYSGTGSAIRYPQVNTGSIGSSWQSNRNIYRGFSILQDGTARTGNGIYLSYGSHNLFEDLGLGCPRALLSSGETDNGLAYGIRFEGPASDEVADFNTFRGCTFLGNTLGLYMQNQCDNAKFYDCHFEPRQDAGVDQNGLSLGNGQGWTIHGCHFNYYNFDANSYGIRLNTVVQGVDIAGNYFEGNSNDIYLYTDGHQKGIHIHGNFSTGASTTTHVGVRAGLDGATYTLKGLVIEGNSFNGLSTGEIGIRIGSDVKDFKLIGNTYDITGGGTEVSLQTGCRGIRFEPTASSTAYPRLQVVDSAQDQGHIILLTNSLSAESSPRLYFAPGNSGNVFSLSADSAGVLTGKDNSGTTIWQVTQAGAVIAASHVTAGGQIRRSVSATVTASTTHTQVGGTALTADINNVSVCANADDAVTLPTAVAGMHVTVINSGAQNLRIWPASGDNLGTGVDTVRGALAAAALVRFVALDATTWKEV